MVRTFFFANFSLFFECVCLAYFSSICHICYVYIYFNNLPNICCLSHAWINRVWNCENILIHAIVVKLGFLCGTFLCRCFLLLLIFIVQLLFNMFWKMLWDSEWVISGCSTGKSRLLCCSIRWYCRATCRAHFSAPGEQRHPRHSDW